MHPNNFLALFVVIGVVVSVSALGLWLVHLSSGRPIREMLALLAAAFVIIVLVVPLVLVFHEWSSSDDVAIRGAAHAVFALILLPVAFVVWRFFNKLSRPKREVESRDQNHNHHEPIA